MVQIFVYVKHKFNIFEKKCMIFLWFWLILVEVFEDCLIFCYKDPFPNPADQIETDPNGSGSATLKTRIRAQNRFGIFMQDLAKFD